jgi:hypothetical protein
VFYCEGETFPRSHKLRVISASPDSRNRSAIVLVKIMEYQGVDEISVFSRHSINGTADSWEFLYRNLGVGDSFLIERGIEGKVHLVVARSVDHSTGVRDFSSRLGE